MCIRDRQALSRDISLQKYALDTQVIATNKEIEGLDRSKQDASSLGLITGLTKGFGSGLQAYSAAGGFKGAPKE